MFPYRQKEVALGASHLADSIPLDDMRKLRKNREERLPSLRALFDILEGKGFIDYEGFRTADLIELQAGDAPITPIIREKCREKGFTPKTWAVDADPEACAQIKSHEDIPSEQVVNRDTVAGFEQIIDSRVQPHLVTLTNYYPQHNISLTDLILAISARMQGGSKLLITCSDDVKTQYDELEKSSDRKKVRFLAM